MRRARLIALSLASLASAGAAASSCSLIVGDETISGRVVEAGSGGATDCASKVKWSHVIQGKATDVSVAHAAAGYTVLAATVSGPVAIEGETLAALGGALDHDILVAVYEDADPGKIVWKRRIGGAGDDRAVGVAIASSKIIVAVNYQPSFRLDPDPMCDTGVDTGVNNHAALLELEPIQQGACTHAHDIFFGPGEVHDIAVAQGGPDIWTLSISNNPTLSIGHWASVSGGPRLGGGSPPSPEGLAMAAIGNTGFVAGGFVGSLSDYQSTAVLQSKGSSDAFVLRFNWNVSEEKVLGDGGVAFGDADFQTFRRVSTDGKSLFLIGDVAGSIDLGGGVLSSAGGTDVIVAQREPDLSAVWSVRFGGEGDEKGTAIAVEGDVVAIGGDHAGGFDLGAPMVGYGKRDAFVAALDATQGTPLWSCSFGGEGDDFVKSVAVTSNGEVIAAGTFQGRAAFGSMLDAGAEGDAIFIVKIAGGG